MITTESSVITLGSGHRIIHYRFEDTPHGDALLRAFARSYLKRLEFDDNVKKLYLQYTIVLTRERHVNAYLTVNVVFRPVGIYETPHGYAGEIARQTALDAGLRFYESEDACESIRIGVGDQQDSFGEYFLLKEILYKVPTLI